MSQFTTKLEWHRNNTDFTYETYNRNHKVALGSGAEFASSAAPEYKGDPSKANPEELLVAAISSCHMLTFLAVAARKRFIVDTYIDNADGTLNKGEDGRMAVTQVTLRPEITFSGTAPSAEALQELHKKAHENCFIANSVKTNVTIAPTQ